MSQSDHAVLANTDSGSFRHPTVNLPVPPTTKSTEGSMLHAGCPLLLRKDLFAEPETRLTNRSSGSARNSGLGLKVIAAAERAEMARFLCLIHQIHSNERRVRALSEALVALAAVADG